MAIFYALVQENVAPSATLFTQVRPRSKLYKSGFGFSRHVISVVLFQISSLVSLGMLTSLGGSDSLESPKFKCVVGLDLIKSVAKCAIFSCTYYRSILHFENS